MNLLIAISNNSLNDADGIGKKGCNLKEGYGLGKEGWDG